MVQLDEFVAEPITDFDHIKKTFDQDYKVKMEILCLTIQKKFIACLEQFDEKRFLVDRWLREEGGGGITCVIQDGTVFEKAGVNISVVHGPLNPPMVQYMKARGKDFGPMSTFFACGISSVIHPKNPHIPTIHFNFRYFCVDENDGQNNSCWWYGGGTDLTPYYLNEKDCQHFHQVLKDACDTHDLSYYPEFKKQCDEYFYVKHRGESRGIGGIFFDDLTGPEQQSIFSFIQSCADSIIPAYEPIVRNNLALEYGNSEREWQLLRRGRYVEFNLLYDRGTKFGLTTPGARYESILISLPLLARWEYCHEPKPGTKEFELLEVLRKPKDWI